MKRDEGRIVGLAVLATLLVLVVGGLIFMYAGLYNVAATEGHTALGEWILNTGQNRSVAVRASDVPEPPPVDSSMVEHGFEHFRTMCVVCHGAPGVERGEFGRGMTPTPPALSEAAGQFSSRELFWIAKHGIKLAGMPAFGPTHSDEEIWGIVAFLKRLEGMSEEEYARWEVRYAPAAGESSGADQGHTHAPGATDTSH